LVPHWLSQWEEFVLWRFRWREVCESKPRHKGNTLLVV